MRRGVDDFNLHDFKTISPQGDGNPSFPILPRLFRHFKTISPQGDGNLFVFAINAIPSPNISKPYPRKGTETNVASPNNWLEIDFKTISPQGDGNLTYLTF